MSFTAPCRNFIMLSITICTLSAQPAHSDASIADHASQFSKLATARSETLGIMGGDNGATGGTYKFYDDGTTMSVTKLGGRGTIGNARRIGGTSLSWVPMLGGTVGYIDGKNRFLDNPVLVNNTEHFSTTAAGAEAGAKFYLTREISITPMLGLIYSYSESRFSPGTALGAKLKQQYSGQLFDWDLQSLCMVPSADIQYEKPLAEDWKLTLSSRYAWFNTWHLASSSTYLRGSGNSYDWKNKADIDVRLPLKFFGFPLHTGGFVSLDILGRDFRDTVGSNAMYTFNGRVVLGDLRGRWNLNWIGLGLSYIKSDTFYGYSIGLDTRLQF